MRTAAQSRFWFSNGHGAKGRFQPSLRDLGVRGSDPKVETLGYSGMSLRDREQPATRSSGFTLIEVVISAALMALILTSGYVCLNAAISTQKMVEPRGEILQNARVALNLIAADLRCACPLSKETD